jgi:hypothetical protein
LTRVLGALEPRLRLLQPTTPEHHGAAHCVGDAADGLLCPAVGARELDRLLAELLRAGERTKDCKLRQMGRAAS